MPHRYSYEKLLAPEFERLVRALVDSDPEFGSKAAVLVGFTNLGRNVDARGSLHWLSTMLERNNSRIREQASRGALKFVLATTYAPAMKPDAAGIEMMRENLAQRARKNGLQSLHVWWRDDLDARFQAASNVVRLEFFGILSEEEQAVVFKLQERLLAASHDERGDFRDIGLTWMPAEVVRGPSMTTLNLANNRLTSLPPEIGRPRLLKALYLQGNQLASLPAEIGRLTNLETLVLRNNELSELPPEIGGLTKLKALDLQGNQLTSLPPEIGRLTNLETLDLVDNKLSQLPAELGRLTKLKTLSLQGNPLGTIPSEISQLTSLDTLHLQSTEITEIPRELSNLVHLQLLGLQHNRITVLPSELGDRIASGLIIRLDANPLAEPFPELLERGPEALASYLRSLHGAVAHYEAKVLLVGEGNVGKTSLVAAIRHAPFIKDRPTTHGIEVRSITMRHPEDHELDMTVRTWDFGGQEVYRITHQFFFSNRALYLVVWNARQGQEQDEVDGWLRRIRVRVGSKAQTLLVATHCDERRPELDYPHLSRTFPDMLNGQFDVDSRTGTGIDTLREALAEQVARLPHMGQLLNRQWISARDEILDRDEPQIPYEEFAAICRRHRLADDEITTLAELLHDLGQIVYYGEDDGLRDVVVLNPEWLTKAIGYVLEDRCTRDAGGVLNHARLTDIWQHTPDGFSYPTRYHRFFLRLMEKFDVSYRLDDERHSLVAQLVNHSRPELLWDSDVPPQRGVRSLAFTCRLSEPAPGLIAWLTVRHHRATTGNHWRRGVFLRHPIRTYASEALVELRSDRELVVEVRASSPDMYFNVLLDSVEDLLRRRWPGLAYTLSIPCPTRDRHGTPCAGRFPLDGLLRLRESGGISHTCLECNTTHDVPELLTGFSRPTPEFQPELERLDRRMSEVLRGVDELRGYAAEAADSLNRVLKTVGTEVTDCPRLFTLTQEKTTSWQRLRPDKRTYRLVLWCEHPGAWHTWPRATYQLQQPRDWLVKVAPYASLIFKTLRLVAPIVKDVAGLDADQFAHAKEELELMKTLVEKLPGATPEEPDPELAVASSLTSAEGEALRALRVLLFEHDRLRAFGGLRRVHAPAGDFLWVCADHYRNYDPGLPNL